MRQYISPSGHDFTKFIKSDENITMFEEMCAAEERTKGVPVKDCIHDIIKALKLGRELQGKDPNTVILARTQMEGLAKLQAFSKVTQN